jgi:hypothetical protein
VVKGCGEVAVKSCGEYNSSLYIREFSPHYTSPSRFPPTLNQPTFPLENPPYRTLAPILAFTHLARMPEFKTIDNMERRLKVVLRASGPIDVKLQLLTQHV